MTMPMRVLTIVAVALTLVMTVSAQSRYRLRLQSVPAVMSNPIDAARRPPTGTWETVGATVVNRTTQCGSTIAAYTGTAATINNALSSCPSGQFVLLGAGTFTLSDGIAIRNNNITLRGAGSNGVGNGGTLIVFNGDCDSYSVICVKTSNDTDASTLQNTGTWTAASYAKGATQITLTRNVGSTAPVVGALLVLDQGNDSNTDTGNIWVCSEGGGSPDICSDEGGGANSRTVSSTKYGSQQVVSVTAVSGTNPYTVTFTPGLAMPNWRSAQSPGAWWPNQTAVTGIGVEDLEIDGSGLTGTSHGNIIFQNATNSWVARIKSRFGARWHVRFQQSNYITVRDSYLDEDQNHAQQAYGFEWYGASNILVENNIMHHVTLPIAFNETGTGSVVAYNYALDNTYTPSSTFMIAGYGLHEVGVEMILFEGNDGSGGFISDDIHGTHHFITVYRNRFLGRDNSMETQSTNPIHVYSYGRYYNFLGNVLGLSGYHDNYGTGNATSIYVLGDNGCNVGCTADSLVASTLFRWGNYDTVNGSSRFNSGEVPSGISPYPNPLPSTQTLPTSQYLSVKPAFFKSTAWPAVGPDVTGGDISNVGGHAYRNPARQCYEAGPLDGNGQMTAFNPTTCYS